MTADLSRTGMAIQSVNYGETSLNKSVILIWVILQQKLLFRNVLGYTRWRAKDQSYSFHQYNYYESPSEATTRNQQAMIRVLITEVLQNTSHGDTGGFKERAKYTSLRRKSKNLYIHTNTHHFFLPKSRPLDTYHLLLSQYHSFASCSLTLCL